MTEEKTVNTFRTTYRELSSLEKMQIEEVKAKADVLMAAFRSHKPSRENSLAQTKLEECVMWAVKGITG